MKKLRFSFLIMAVLAAVCFISCTNKDDDDNDQKSAIVKPKYYNRDGRIEGIACIIEPNPSIELTNGYKLLSFEFTESGRAYITVEKESKRTVFNASFTYDYENEEYTIVGDRISGTIKRQMTLASQNEQFKVSIKIKNEVGEISAETTSGAAIAAIKTVDAMVGGDVDIISSWIVRGIVINVDGDYNFFREFPDGDLKKILDYAKTEHEVKFTDKEEKELSKVIQYVSISTKNITIDYADGTSDVAEWDWAGSSVFDKLDIKKFQEEGMGNKFIVADRAVKIEFNKPKAYLNIVFSAVINDGDKHYNSSLTLRLAQQPEFTVPVEN